LRTTAVAIIPEGQSAEYMGIYLFWGQVLSWVPPLVFTSLNEAGVSQRIALATQDVYFLIGFVAYCFMGSYRAAVNAAQGAFSRAAKSAVTTEAVDPPESSPA
jgi:MFS-type transporter involved in bile tolerance (Atg22 family)